MNGMITLLDGAGGTVLWNKAESLGFRKEPVWKYNIEHPDIVKQVAAEYVEAGSQIILANTFGANGPAVKRSSDYSVEEVVRAGVRIAKDAVLGSDVKVALDVGPLTALMEPYGDLTEEEAEEIFREQIGAGMKEDPDLIFLETFLDLEMLKVAARVAKSYSVPVFCTMTFEGRGRTMMGNCVEDIVDELAELGVDAIGLNCSQGPEVALPVMAEFAEHTELPLIFKPNAGKPVLAADGAVVSPYDADAFVRDVEPVLDKISYLGCCCGSDPSYIRALQARLKEM